MVAILLNWFIILIERTEDGTGEAVCRLEYQRGYNVKK